MRITELLPCVTVNLTDYFIPGRNTVTNTPETMTFLGTQDAAIIASAPTPSGVDIITGANVWDFENIDFMNDSSLWAGPFGSITHGVYTAEPLRELQELQFQTSEYSRNIHVFDRHCSPDANQLPTIFDMRNIWFTKVQRSEESIQESPPYRRSSTTISHSAISPREPELVDDESLRGLSNALIHPFPQEHLLPSSEFLVE